MVHYQSDIPATFAALGDPTRCAIVARLAEAPLSVSDLAAPLDMSLQAVRKHLGVLETAGLIESEKRGRVRRCRLRPQTLQAAEAWISDRRALWEGRLDALDGWLKKEGGSNA